MRSAPPAHSCGHRGRRSCNRRWCSCTARRCRLAGAWPRASCTMSVSASAASCCSTLWHELEHGRVLMWRGSYGNWKHYTGCEKSLLISYGIQRRRRFAFEENSEYGSLQGWDDYSTHASDTGVVTTTLWCRQLTQQSGGAQLLSIVNHQLVQYFGLQSVSYSLSSFPYHVFCIFFLHCIVFLKLFN